MKITRKIRKEKRKKRDSDSKKNDKTLESIKKQYNRMMREWLNSTD